jgi:hypothetical protein
VIARDGGDEMFRFGAFAAVRRKTCDIMRPLWPGFNGVESEFAPPATVVTRPLFNWERDSARMAGMSRTIPAEYRIPSSGAVALRAAPRDRRRAGENGAAMDSR